MAVEVAELIAHFKADTTKYIRDVEKAGAATTKTGAQADAGAMKFKKIQTASKLAAVAGIAVLAVGLDKSFKAAVKAQQSTARLDAAYKAVHLSASKYAKDNDDLEAAGRKLGFSNIDVRNSMASLVTATGSQTMATKQLSIAQDLARYKNVDLTTATRAMAMANTGSARALKQLGIAIVPVTTAEEKVKLAFQKHTGAAYDAAMASAKLSDHLKTQALIVDTVGQKVHGQAAAYASTAAGGMAQFHAQLEQIEEVIGNMLIPVMTKLSQVVAEASGWLGQHAGVAKVLLGVILAVIVALGAVAIATKIYAAEQYIASAATTIWTAATEGLNAAMEMNPIGAVVLLIALLVVAIIEIVKHFDFFKGAVEACWDGMKSATDSFVSFFTTSVPNAVGTVVHAITDGLNSAKDWVKGHWPEIATIISGPFAPIVALATGAFGIREKIMDGLKEAKDWVSGHWGAIAGFISNPLSDLVGAAEGAFGIKGALRNAWDDIKSGVRTAFSALGSIAKGAFTAPVNAIIGALDAIHIGIHKGAVKVFGHTIFPGINWDWTPFNIPQLATGGIVNKPTLAMIGEAGPEAVVPLSRGRGHGLGGGDTYNFSFPNYLGSKREVVEMVRSELLVQKRRRTALGLS